MWLFYDPTASWQTFAMALHLSALDGALRHLKVLNFLSLHGTLKEK